jgi:hypothetical protein
VNEFETTRKAFEKETIGQMTSNELDLGAELAQVLALHMSLSTIGLASLILSATNLDMCFGRTDELPPASLLESCAFLVRTISEAVHVANSLSR